MTTSISRCNQGIEAAKTLIPINKWDAVALVAGLAASVWISPSYCICYPQYKFLTSDWLRGKLFTRISVPTPPPLSEPKGEIKPLPPIPLRSDCSWQFDTKNPSMCRDLKKFLTKQIPGALGVVVVNDTRGPSKGQPNLSLLPLIAYEQVPIHRTSEPPRINYGEVIFTIPFPGTNRTLGFAKIIYQSPRDGESQPVCRILDLYNEPEGDRYALRHRFEGVGTALVKAILQYNKEQGLKSQNIEVDAAYASHGFYYRLGFRSSDIDTNEDIRYAIKNGRSTESLGSVIMSIQPEFLKVWLERIQTNPIGFPPSPDADPGSAIS